MTDPEGVNEAARELEQGLLTLEELGDDRTLAMAWRLKAQLDVFGFQLGRVEEAAKRALGYARRAGDDAERNEIESLLIDALWLGPTAVPIAIAQAETMAE